MNEFGLRLKRLREHADETQTELARILNVTPQMVSKLEMGKSKPSIEILKTLSRHFQTSIEGLLGLEAEDEKRNKGHSRMLPLVGKIAAGKPILANENILDWIPAIPGVNGDFYLLVKGNSMEPLIRDGAMVLVKREKSLRRGAVGAFIINQYDSVIKRYYPDTFGVVLRSDNPAFEPIFFNRDNWDNDCIILGRVVKIILDI
ncbi:MAG TPA: XRE family transcriptional regulator [Thermotogota bacterium]|nr:XRE family transcriptional regulator [Thermotogota bacterium]HPJ90125.1 XRE family transcriptional regulator [Thermotogota bacterium]HPR96991.1 XRE family transcriptional regulator [Thermotogota bacterium]